MMFTYIGVSIERCWVVFECRDGGKGLGSEY